MSERHWTDEHGEDGLRRKFDVYKHRDRWANDEITYRNMYYEDDRIGADGEFVFVLRPETDREAWLALRKYAIGVRHRAPQLGIDIGAELLRISLDQHRV